MPIQYLTPLHGKDRYKVVINFKLNGKYKKISKTVYSEEEAIKTEREMQLRIKDDPKTFSELFFVHCESIKNEVKESTFEKKKEIIENHVMPFFSSVDVKSITVNDLQRWKNHINNMNLSLNMKRNIYVAFSSVLEYGYTHKFIERNCLKTIGNFRDNGNNPLKIINFYTVDEFKSYRQAMEENTNKYFGKKKLSEYNYNIFFNIAFFTGMREGEILALNWNDIDFAKRVIRVTKSLNQKLKGEDRITAPKTLSSIRNVSLPLVLMEILKEHKKRWQESDEDFKDTYFVCGGERAIRTTTLSNRNRLYADLAGLKKIRIHDFRHSHVSMLVDIGEDIYVIANRLGHGDIATTLRTYVHMYPTRDEEAAAKINNVA